jgi:aryl-alcohol dehydrogenase-like predicted oxidoreductase
MRYRPLGNTSMTVSTLSLRLKGERCAGNADAWLGLVHSAFENGVNSLEIVEPTPALLTGVGEAIQAVERRLIFLTLRLSPDLGPDEIFRDVDAFMVATGVSHLDLTVIDGDREIHNDAIWMLEDLRATGKVKRIGVAGQTDAVNRHIDGGVFDVLVAPFNILSGWRERLRVRTAVERAMSVIGSYHFPEEARMLAEPKAAKRGWFSKPKYPLAGLGSYNFLHSTHGWTAEEICLGFTLTEPSVASVALEVDNLDHLVALSAVTERDLPSAVAAQIEMARFSAERASGAERRSA